MFNRVVTILLKMTRDYYFAEHNLFTGYCEKPASIHVVLDSFTFYTGFSIGLYVCQIFIKYIKLTTTLAR